MLQCGMLLPAQCARRTTRAVLESAQGAISPRPCLLAGEGAPQPSLAEARFHLLSKDAEDCGCRFILSSPAAMLGALPSGYEQDRGATNGIGYKHESRYLTVVSKV